MTFIQIPYLFFALTAIVCVAAFLFKKYQRAIFWGVALTMFIGISLLLGTGVFKTYEDGQINLTSLFWVIMCYAFSFILMFFAEKLKDLKEGDGGNKPKQSTRAQSGQEGIVLSEKLNTPLAKEIFAKAIKAGLMEEDGSHYKWLESRNLLVYMCGRIYCEDRTELDSRYGEKMIWKHGNVAFFPGNELSDLFQQKKLSQARHNRKDYGAPLGYERVDRLFD